MSTPRGWRCSSSWSSPVSTAEGRSMPEARVIPLDGRDEPRASRSRRPQRCSDIAADGPRCRRSVVAEGLWDEHLTQLQQAQAEAELPDWERKVAGALAFLRRRVTGEYPIDDFGFDPDLTEHLLLAAVRPLYEKYFRIETRGMENIPEVGGALVVANHSGTVPIDALMTQLAIYDHHPAKRHLRMLGADLVFRSPLIAPLARKSGSTLACNEDAERLMSSGELAGVWPEGFKGIGKPFSERYRLQRFGRGGVVAAGARSGVPILPCSIGGAEEIYPVVGNVKILARLFGLPYVPVTPFFPLLGPLGLLPLPSKWIIEFGEPIATDELGPRPADDPMLVFNLTDQVREVIQQTLYKLLLARRSVFF